MMELSATEKAAVEGILLGDVGIAGAEAIVRALKMRGLLVGAVLPKSPGAEKTGHFLDRFWDWRHSPYVREKLAVGQSIHKRYVEIMKARCRLYWRHISDIPVGEITVKDIRAHLCRLATLPQLVITSKKDADGKRIYERRMLKAETVNQIVRAATCALRWAYNNGLTSNDCFSGIRYCHVTPEKRHVMTMSQAAKLFSIPWDDDESKLANLTSACTGMRMGEVQALHLSDLGDDRIFVRHSWARLDGLKCPKNGSCREIMTPKPLISMLRRKAEKNPWFNECDPYIFWSPSKNKPGGGQKWNKSLKKSILKAGLDDCGTVTFHCWRHFFTTNMADNIDERKLQLETGHKSLDMLEHYAAHRSEEAMEELGLVSNRLFGRLVIPGLSPFSKNG